MSSIEEPLTQFRDLVENATGGLPAARVEWLARRRRAASERLQRARWPGRKDEAWRYTSLQPLREQKFRLADRRPSKALTAGEIESLFVGSGTSRRLVFVNGRFEAGFSDLADLPTGVRIGSLRHVLETEPELVEQYLGVVSGEGEDSPFTALNTALITDGALVIVPQGTLVETPLEILHLAVEDGAPLMVQPRNLVVLEAGARASLVERYQSLDRTAYFRNGVSEIALGEGARLAHDRLQEESPLAFHLAGLHIRLAARSEYQCASAALGAAWSRTEFHVRFAGEGASSRLDGLYFAGDRTLVDNHLDIEHAVPGCRSQENFRGILDGRGAAVFDGRVVVAKDAQKTDAHLANANLMLSRNAEVDTKPQLEIYADDVQCSHGTTVGQLDTEAVFYLRSRGIPLTEARKLLCLGFAGEVLARFGDVVQPRVERAIRARLEGAAAIAGQPSS